MIKSLLIANRGEIACRIIRTARKMGIKTIAVYSHADRDALHVRMADEAHLLGAAPASESYLRAGRILKIAKECGADAIHPGYGFLSENADFAQLTADAGMIFVGPPPNAITAMGLKDKAKEIMAEAKVPVVPGYHGTNQDPVFLKRKAYEIGYPVLIKAVAGGGGKGMRKVDKALDFDDALDAAKREAQASFGNEVVLIEKYVQSPRHIEIQVFGDSKGNVVHLFERDCSLQRRHQKVIEEAPAPGMTASVRKAMGQAACDAARAVNYQGAGTVEFIVDGAEGLRDDGFWFMEMNTRLQVEHPVTEMITGVDLVEWQLHVAQGEALPLAQDEIKLNGHAFEARVYAEDVAAGFLPSTGRLIALNLGEEDDQHRVETGVECGDVISPYYDPMIAKLVVHRPNRREALAALETRLRDSRIAGPATNLSFLHSLATNKEFSAENFDTNLIENKFNELIQATDIKLNTVVSGVAELIATSQKSLLISSTNQSSCNAHSPWHVLDAFQLSGEREFDWQFLLNGQEQEVRIRFTSTDIHLQFEDGGEWIAHDPNCNVYHDGQKVLVLSHGVQYTFEAIEHSLKEEGVDSRSDGAVSVPMHGKIIALTVGEGEAVEQGDMLFSVEAMKMEHAVLAPCDGTVSDVTIEAEQQVEAGVIAMRVTGDQE